MCVVDIAERSICKYTYMCSYQILQVIFWPDNIVGLFKRFGVKKNFDFLSEDSDSYDFFMTEAILEVTSKKIGKDSPKSSYLKLIINQDITKIKSPASLDNIQSSRVLFLNTPDRTEKKYFAQ